jgi:hypothetical protein
MRVILSDVRKECTQANLVRINFGEARGRLQSYVRMSLKVISLFTVSTVTLIFRVGRAATSSRARETILRLPVKHPSRRTRHQSPKLNPDAYVRYC